MFYLTGKSGPVKGFQWPVVQEPLILGRDVSCHININDPLVSRQHCKITPCDTGVEVEDLGSSNSTFVNAHPVSWTIAVPGDEIAVGSAILLVTALQEVFEPPASSSSGRTITSALRLGQPMYVDSGGDSLFARGLPSTAEDMALLFEISRAMSQKEILSEIVELLREQIVKRFQPAASWVVLAAADSAEASEIYPLEEAAALFGDENLMGIIREALGQSRGVLLPESWKQGDEMGIRSTLVAPIALGTQSLGGLVIQTNTPMRIYDEGDLEFLLAMAHAAAPYLKSVEKLETLAKENRRLMAGTAGGGPLIGQSRAMSRVRSLVRICARSEMNVLILGDTGTGKELAARLVHDLSPRADKAFTTVNCAAIPNELMESELFGHERGSFTGAHTDRGGLFEESDGGTLFLDEVGDLSLQNQARLLRAIETGSFRRVGGNKDIQVDVRIVAATNKDPQQEVLTGAFRRDLYHRLNTFEILLPPLTERRSDIPLLARHFLQESAKQTGKPVKQLSPEAESWMKEQSWLGNVREVRNVVERGALVSRGAQIELADLTAFLRESPQTASPVVTLAEMERQHIQKALEACDGNISAAADALGIGRSTLYRKVNEYGLSVE